MKTLVALIGMTLMLGAAHADTPEKAKSETTIITSVTVTRIDVAQRLLTIRQDTGDEYTIDVDPAVKNLAQIKVGDKIVVTYHQSVVANMARAKDPTGTTNTVEVEAAKAGQRPGAAARSTTNIPVTIVSVDTKKNIVEFRGADNLVRIADVVSPEGQAFIKTLKAHDQVVLTYTESVAISVDPKK